MINIKEIIIQLKKIAAQQAGIGLVETLVAITILGLSATCFVSSLSVGARSVNTIDEQAIAQQLLTSEMESLKSLTYDVTGHSYTTIAVPEGYLLSLDVNSDIFSDSDIQKISATVWHNGVKVATLENYKSNR